MSKTILYHTELQREASEVLENGYRVDGKKVKPKQPIVELNYIKHNKPIITEFQKLIEFTTVTEKDYIIDYTVIDLTTDEINAIIRQKRQARFEAETDLLILKKLSDTDSEVGKIKDEIRDELKYVEPKNENAE
jgi:hypothetical protein